MPKLSAGILMFRKRSTNLEVFLVHPGGPFWRNKDKGAWSIPKGEHEEADDPLEAAKREFHEETGFEVSGKFLPLGQLVQPSRKVVTAWAVKGDCSPTEIRSNSFAMEWPPKSGRYQQFPEIDRAAWFTLDEGRQHILKGQLAFIDRLVALVSADSSR